MNYKEQIRYEPETGDFFWLVGRPGVRKGSRAGGVSKTGYVLIKIGRTQIRAHRLAWFLSHGEWPNGEIDHINGAPSDNRLCNLRVVDRAGNSQNRRKAHRDNASGLLGATWNKQHRRWQSAIQANKKLHHLGYFKTAQEAHNAYLIKKQELHIGCSI